MPPTAALLAVGTAAALGLGSFLVRRELAHRQSDRAQRTRIQALERETSVHEEHAQNAQGPRGQPIAGEYELGEQLGQHARAQHQLDIVTARERAQKVDLEIARQRGQCADAQHHARAAAAVAERAEQLVAEREDRVRVIEGDAPGLGQDQLPTATLEFERVELPAPPFAVTGMRVESPLGPRPVTAADFPVLLAPLEALVADLTVTLASPGDVQGVLTWFVREGSGSTSDRDGGDDGERKAHLQR